MDPCLICNRFIILLGSGHWEVNCLQSNYIIDVVVQKMANRHMLASLFKHKSINFVYFLLCVQVLS